MYIHSTYIYIYRERERKRERELERETDSCRYDRQAWVHCHAGMGTFTPGLSIPRSAITPYSTIRIPGVLLILQVDLIREVAAHPPYYSLAPKGVTGKG